MNDGALTGSNRVVPVAIGLGSNLGDRTANLEYGRNSLAARGIQWVSISSLYETDPVGPVADQPPFLNQVAIGETELPPHTLFQICMNVERERGRERTIHWGPRTLDLDILLYGEAQIATPELTVPHREMTGRAFVLIPLAEAAPDWIIPGGNGKTAAELASTVEGREGVRLWRSSAI